MVFRPSVVNATQQLWCSRTNTTERQFSAFVLNTSNGKMRFDRDTVQVTSTTTLLACTNYLVVADYGARTAVVTNIAANTEAVNVTMGGADEYTPNSELCLLCSHNGLPTTSNGNYGSYVQAEGRGREPPPRPRAGAARRGRRARPLRPRPLHVPHEHPDRRVHDCEHADDHAFRSAVGGGAHHCGRHHD